MPKLFEMGHNLMCAASVAATIIVRVPELSRSDTSSRRSSENSAWEEDPLASHAQILQNRRRNIWPPAADGRRCNFRFRQLIDDFNHTNTDSCIVTGRNTVRTRRKMNTLIFRCTRIALASQQQL